MSFRTAAIITCALAAGTILGIPSAQAATNDVWTGMGDGSSWSRAANWSGGVPQPGDSVTIAPPSSDHCFAHVLGAPRIALADLTLHDSGSVSAPCLASVSGAGFTVSHTLTLSGGVLDAPTTLLAGATGSVVPMVDDTTEFTENVTVQGTLTLQDNTYDGVHDPDRSVELQAGTSLVVAPGGVLNAEGTNTVDATSCCQSPGRIINNGKMNDTGSLTLDDVELDQNGVLDVADAGDEVVSLGAPNTAGDGAQYTGAGDYRVTEASAVDTLTGTQTLGPHFRFVLGGNAATSRVDADGNESLHGTFTFAGSGEVDWLGGELAADITVGHGVRVIADSNVVGGNDDERAITDVDHPYDGSTPHPGRLTNHGALQFSGGAVTHFSGDSRIYNAADGTVSLAASTSLVGDCCSTQGDVVNQGGAVSVPASAAGTAVTFDGVGYSATGGTTTIAGGQTMTLTGGATSLLASTSIDGGTLRVADPVHLSKTVSLHGTVVQLRDGSSLEDVRTAGKGLEAATLTGDGALAWTGGTLSGLLTVRLAAVAVSGHGAKGVGQTSKAKASHVTISAPLSVAAGANDHDGADTLEVDAGCTLETAGTTTVRGDVHVFGGHLLNRGVFTVAAGKGKRAYVTGEGTFTNVGTVHVTSGTFALDNSYVQTAGGTAVSTGAALREIGSSSAVRIARRYGSDPREHSDREGHAGTHGLRHADRARRRDDARHECACGRGVARPSRCALGNRTRVAHRPPQGDERCDTARGDRPVPASAGAQLATNRLCTTTAGSGAGSHHWQAVISGHDLVLRWVTGRRTTC